MWNELLYMTRYLIARSMWNELLFMTSYLINLIDGATKIEEITDN